MQETSAVDDYIAASSEPVRAMLEAMRARIRASLPDASEKISYGIPTFVQDGRNVIHFGGYPGHLALYPAPREHPDFRDELAAYAGGKGTVRFPLDRPIPWALVDRIVAFCAQEARGPAAKRRPPRR